MQELRAVLDAADQLAVRGGEGVLATVVRVEGSTYRRPGARLVIGPKDAWVGGISGGCLEGDLVRKAWWRTAHGPAIVAYDATADDDNMGQPGLGCNGIVHVLLERFGGGRADPLAFVRHCVRHAESGIQVTVLQAEPATGLAPADRFTLTADGQWSGNGIAAVEPLHALAVECLTRKQSQTEIVSTSSGDIEAFFEFIRPPIRLVIFGAGLDAIPLIRSAHALGWHVIVVSRRPATVVRSGLNLADEFVRDSAAVACARLRLDERTAAIVMNHNYPDDRDAVAGLLRSRARFVGVLGPRERTERMLAEIGETELDHLDRLFAPVGLDIGADGPEEIAAAIVGQVIAVFADRPAGHLRDRPGPIHRRPPAPATQVLA